MQLFSRFKGLIIIAGILLIVGMYLSSWYNSTISLSEDVATQWSQVESQYQRRFDLIPNLVASVEGIMKQEVAVFTAIADARKGYAGARTPDEKVIAAGQMESALGRLLVITENYPQLTSNQSVQALMTQLEGTENRIAVERMRYNDVTKAYNLSVKTFPGTLFAKLFGFAPKNLFESESGAEKAPQVKINQ